MKKRVVSVLTVILILGSAAAVAQKPAEKPQPADDHRGPVANDIHYLDENGVIRRGTRCGTPATSEAEKARVRSEVEARAPFVFLKAVTVIPVAFHVVHGATEGAVSMSQVNDQIDVLNSAYADTAFSFYLASVDYTENENWFSGCHAFGKEKKMKQALAIDPAHNLNVYTCKPGAGYFGWSYTAWYQEESHYIHGPVVHFETLPGGAYAPFNLGDTLTHETGHYLGLEHTFEGGCNEPGDEVDDTPPEQSAASGCPIGRDTCPGDGPDPVTNFMDYSDDACIDEFTPGQDERMQMITALYRPSLGT